MSEVREIQYITPLTPQKRFRPAENRQIPQSAEHHFILDTRQHKVIKNKYH